VLVAADRKKGEGRPEYRALEVVVEKLQRIQRDVGSATRVLPRQTARSVTEVLSRAHATAEQEMDNLLSDEALEAGDEDLTRLSITNERELREAEQFVSRFPSTDDFATVVLPVLETAFRSWDDGGRIDALATDMYSVRVPARLRGELRRDEIPTATFSRVRAVAGQDETDDLAPEFLSPAHPLVEAVLRRLREEGGDATFRHRFDVSSGEPGLVLSFAMRFVDGEGRTLDERLEAVEVLLDGRASGDASSDLAQLAITATTGTGGLPDPTAIPDWQARFSTLLHVAREEADRRAERHRIELEQAARELHDEEIANLALWRRAEERRVETITLGTDLQVSFESAEEYERLLKQLETEYEARRELIRDRSAVRLAGLELVGGRLYVGAAA
jgi:hypothetical protein